MDDRYTANSKSDVRLLWFGSTWWA